MNLVRAVLNNGDTLASRYQVERVLGQGGMGAVYLARDLRIPCQWAVKEMTAEPEAEAMFRAEAEVLCGLKHPNLPRITDFFGEDGKQYLVMDYVEGPTLEQVLSQRQLTLAEVIDLGRQLSEVLEYLHGLAPPLIFRDLKPANIIMAPGGTVKLIDFGIARHFQPEKASDTRALGTPGYAAPEQYGHGQSDERTDLYALGATLYHALSGRDPGQAPFQFPPLGLAEPGLEALVLKAVSLEPVNRFQSARELRLALQALGGGQQLPTQVLHSSPAGFDPREVRLGVVRRGQSVKRKIVLKGDWNARLVSNQRWLQVEPEHVQGKDVRVELIAHTSGLKEGGHFQAELTVQGQQGIRPMSVEVDVERAHVSFFSQALSFLLCLASVLPGIGFVATGVLGVAYLSTPRRERAAMRIFVAVATLLSTLWLGFFTLVGVGLYQLPWDRWLQ